MGRCLGHGYRGCPARRLNPVTGILNVGHNGEVLELISITSGTINLRTCIGSHGRAVIGGRLVNGGFGRTSVMAAVVAYRSNSAVSLHLSASLPHACGHRFAIGNAGNVCRRTARAMFLSNSARSCSISRFCGRRVNSTREFRRRFLPSL